MKKTGEAWKVLQSNRVSATMGLHSPALVLKYPKGEVVKAIKGTIGIFCFSDKTSADEFVSTCRIDPTQIVVRCETFGKGRIPPTTIPSICVVPSPQALKAAVYFNWLWSRKSISPDEKRARLKSKYLAPSTWITPRGSVCYPAIRCLE